MGKMMEQIPDGVVRTSGLYVPTHEDAGQERGRRATGRTRGIKVSRRLIRGGPLAGVAFLAIGVSFLAACGSPAGTASHALVAGTQGVMPTDGSSALSLSSPVMIGQAIANEATASSATKASPTTKAQPTHKPGETTPAAQPGTPNSGSSTQGSSQTSIDPSGEDPPTTLSGFTLTHVDDFSSGSMPNGWDAYNGTPGGVSANVAQWVPSMCTFSGGEVHFMNSGIDSCGLQYFGTPQVYGAWFARLKADTEPSNVFTSNVFLLFPASNQWPPEIDIYEDHGSRTSTVDSMYNTVGNACGTSPTAACLAPYAQSNGQSGGVSNNDTQWHTYGVEWTSSGVTWLIDGNVVFSAPASQVQSPAQQPAVPMYMDLQSENVDGAGAPTELESMAVDWVEEYSWNG